MRNEDGHVYGQTQLVLNIVMSNISWKGCIERNTCVSLSVFNTDRLVCCYR